MGINAAFLELLAEHCRRSEPGTALVAGYPDMLVSSDDVQRILGTDKLPYDTNEDGIRRSHGGAQARFFDAASIFNALGYAMDVVDVHRDRGMEKIADLNYPAYLGTYDLVLDHGTIEHVFNIGEAALSLARAVKPGGLLALHLPLAFMCHGFYNLNPVWFRALCEQSGMDILFHAAWNETGGYLPIEIRHRFDVPKNKTMMSMIAQRRREIKAGYPIQDLYQ